MEHYQLPLLPLPALPASSASSCLFLPLHAYAILYLPLPAFSCEFNIMDNQTDRLNICTSRAASSQLKVFTICKLDFKQGKLSYHQSLLNILPFGWDDVCGAVEDKVVSGQYIKMLVMYEWFLHCCHLYRAMATGMALFMAVIS